MVSVTSSNLLFSAEKNDSLKSLSKASGQIQVRNCETWTISFLLHNDLIPSTNIIIVIHGVFSEDPTCNLAMDKLGLLSSKKLFVT
jgi:hypothetical protein